MDTIKKIKVGAKIPAALYLTAKYVCRMQNISLEEKINKLLARDAKNQMKKIKLQSLEELIGSPSSVQDFDVKGDGDD